MKRQNNILEYLDNIANVYPIKLLTPMKVSSCHLKQYMIMQGP